MYPPLEPYAHGLLDVGDGQRVYWETCGNPLGKPALAVHGGPGSGCSPWWRTLFDPQAYRIVLIDQRGCGRSTPHASAPRVDLSANTTAHLVADMERVRTHLEIDRWLLLGGSWGSTLALAYAVAHPEHVSEMVLFGVTTGRHSEFDWAFRGGLGLLFPAEWERLLSELPDDERADVVGAYARRVLDPDPAVHQPAADAWCLWESASPAWPPTTGLSSRFKDPAYALTFARLVLHYVDHNGFLEDGVLLRNLDRLANTPAVLVNGRFDFGAPLANAWTLHRAWPTADLVVVDNAGHAADHPGLVQAIVHATDRFAGPPTA